MDESDFNRADGDMDTKVDENIDTNIHGEFESSNMHGKEMAKSTSAPQTSDQDPRKSSARTTCVSLNENEAINCRLEHTSGISDATENSDGSDTLLPVAPEQSPDTNFRRQSCKRKRGKMSSTTHQVDLESSEFDFV